MVPNAGLRMQQERSTWMYYRRQSRRIPEGAHIVLKVYNNNEHTTPCTTLHSTQRFYCTPSKFSKWRASSCFFLQKTLMMFLHTSQQWCTDNAFSWMSLIRRSKNQSVCNGLSMICFPCSACHSINASWIFLCASGSAFDVRPIEFFLCIPPSSSLRQILFCIGSVIAVEIDCVAI